MSRWKEFFHFLFLSHPSSLTNRSKEAVVNITISDTSLHVCWLQARLFPPSLFILHRNDCRPTSPSRPPPPYSWILTQSRLCPRVLHSSALQQFRCENSCLEVSVNKTKRRKQTSPRQGAVAETTTPHPPPPPPEKPVVGENKEPA